MSHEHPECTILSEYLRGAEAWDSLVGTDAKKANPIFDRLHSLAKELRETPIGRDGLVELMSHEAAGVRLLAATECLAWAVDRAVPVLEEIEGSSSLHAVSAKYTVKSHRSGTLNLDW